MYMQHTKKINKYTVSYGINYLMLKRNWTICLKLCLWNV